MRVWSTMVHIISHYFESGILAAVEFNSSRAWFVFPRLGLQVRQLNAPLKIIWSCVSQSISDCGKSLGHACYCECRVVLQLRVVYLIFLISTRTYFILLSRPAVMRRGSHILPRYSYICREVWKIPTVVSICDGRCFAFAQVSDRQFMHSRR